jgi:elongation factor G
VERFATGQIRNVALVGHNGVGKTSLAEALLHRSGATTRLGRVDDGTTTCDWAPEERQRHMSLSLAVAPFTWRGHKVNLIDTPGYADFAGEVAAALRVADLAVFVVSAVDGVQAQAEAAWRLAAELGLPRLVFLNKLDRERASFDATLAQLQERLGSGIAPLELPIGEEAAFCGIADLLTDTAHTYEGGAPRTGPVPDDMEEREHAVHESLVEGIVVADDALCERYLDGEVVGVDELERTLHDGIAAATVFPVVLGSATREVGIDRLADFLVEIGPSPLDRPATVLAGDTTVEVAADPDGDPLAYVFTTVVDAYVGQVSLFRVLSGTIRTDDHLVNSRTGADQRLHGLLRVCGKDQQPVAELVAGDIGAVAKLSGTATGDTLAPRGTPVRVPPVPRPEPVLAVAVVAASQADDDKLVPALHRLVEEDPALAIERVDETHQTLLRGAGETHLQVAIEKLARKFGVHVTTEDVRIRYRETIAGPAQRVEGRHKKQTGGHGQFGVAVIDVEPLPPGSGFAFVDRIVGGAISRGYIPAVQKGIEEAMASGGAFGFPVVDVRVTLVDGKEHSVDSSEMAFKAAGRLAFRAALDAAGPVLLEPVSRLEVTVPVEVQGDVLGDLNARRGRVQATEAGGPGEQVIVACVPAAEVQRYAVDLRSLTGGRGRFTATHERYDPVPDPRAVVAHRAMAS